MRICLGKYISFAFLNIACQSKIRYGRPELPHASLMGRPGSAFLPRTSRLNRKRTFPRLYYFDAYAADFDVQTLRKRNTRMTVFVSESTDDSRASDSEGFDTEWHSTSVGVSHLAPAAEAEEDLVDFKFGDGPSAGAAAGEDESQWLYTQPEADPHLHTPMHIRIDMM